MEKREQPIYDGSVFVRSECEKIRTVIHYFSHRILVAYLIRTRSVCEGQASNNNGSDGPTQLPVQRALYPGGDFLVDSIEDNFATGFFSFSESA
jgi:hypothetical protein